MRTRIGTIHIVALAALAVGAAAGWFAAGAWGERKCGNVELWNCGNVETANVGRARSSSAPTEKAKPRRKALIRSSADAEVQEKVLRGRIADLKKRLEFARRESEALAEARRKLSKDGIYRAAKNLEEVWLQSVEAKKALGKEDGKATIGEMRALAPDWWDHTEKDLLSGRYDDRLKGVRKRPVSPSKTQNPLPNPIVQSQKPTCRCIDGCGCAVVVI